MIRFPWFFRWDPESGLGEVWRFCPVVSMLTSRGWTSRRLPHKTGKKFLESMMSFNGLKVAWWQGRCQQPWIWIWQTSSPSPNHWKIQKISCACLRCFWRQVTWENVFFGMHPAILPVCWEVWKHPNESFKIFSMDLNLLKCPGPLGLKGMISFVERCWLWLLHFFWSHLDSILV